MVDCKGVPLAVKLTAANVHDSMVFEELVDGIEPIKGPGRGRLRKRPEKLHADKAYDAKRYRDALKRASARLAEVGASTVDADQGLTFDKEFQLPAGVESEPAIIAARGNQGMVKASVSVSTVNGEARQYDPATDGERETSLPDTGGVQPGSVAGGLGIVLIAGGLLLKRRMS